MTAEEYKRALEQLTPDQFWTFRQRWGGAPEGIDRCVEQFVYASPTQRPQFEETIIYRLREFGITDLQTEAEKALGANVIAATAARRSADASERSAAAAERSADSSRTAVHASYLAIVVSLLAIIVAVVQNRC